MCYDGEDGSIINVGASNIQVWEKCPRDCHLPLSEPCVKVYIVCNISIFRELINSVMEPFSHEDPLYKILGKAKMVELRPNFTQNVLRAIRQEPLAESTWSKVKDWFTIRPLYIGVTAAVLLTGLILSIWHVNTKTEAIPAFAHVETPSSTGTTVSPLFTEEATTITDNAVASELGNMDRLSTLLAQEDTSAFSDGEIALLLY